MSAKVAFTTLGCRLNQAESDAMLEDLAGAGVHPAAKDDEPDIVVINTCTVTREATKASRQAIRRAARAHPGAKVVVIGCYAVSDRAEVEAIDGVDVVLGNDDKESFVRSLGRSTHTAPLLQIGLRDKEAVQAPAAQRRVRANLKAQTGCDEWCSFCIIPRTRGPLRSMDEEALIAEAQARVDAGARELVLTGVHLGKYRYDRGGDERDLVRLLNRLLDTDGVWRLRLSSILSRHLTEEVVDLIANEPRICRYLHVPMQSGHDDVLAAMNRPYRIDDYVEALTRVKRAVPGVALATDIIVGFPGETEEHFQATLDVVDEVEFSKLHVFRYSARPGTASAARTDEIASDVKRDRSKRLIDAGNRIRARFLEAHLNGSMEVLVEDERSVDDSAVCSGQTDDYVRVWFEGRGLLGAMVRVEGARIRADGIEGRLVGVARR